MTNSVRFIIPRYNEEEFIEKLLASGAAPENNNFRKIILADNESPDKRLGFDAPTTSIVSLQKKIRIHEVASCYFHFGREYNKGKKSTGSTVSLRSIALLSIISFQENNCQ